MSQSSIIAATLLAGFVLYLAANDRLSVYTAVLWGNTKAPLPSASAPSIGASPAGMGGASGAGSVGGLLGGIGGVGDLLSGGGGIAGLLGAL